MTSAEKRQRTILRKRDIYLRHLCCQSGASKSAVDSMVNFEIDYGDKLRELEDKFDLINSCTFSSTVI